MKKAPPPAADGGPWERPLSLRLGKIKRFEIPGAIDIITTPGRTVAFGTPVEVYAVRTKEPVDSLERVVAKLMMDQGLFLPPPGAVDQLSGMRQLTGLDPDTFIAYTVFFQPNPDKTTTAIFTESYLGERQSVPPTGTADLPAIPGARGLMQSRNEGLEFLTFQTAASRDELQKFYEQTLPKEGWVTCGPSCFRRGSDELKIDVRDLSASSRAVTLTKQPRLDEGVPSSR